MFGEDLSVGFDEQAAVLALVSASVREWYRTANLIEQAQRAVRLLERRWSGFEPFELEFAESLVARVTDQHLERSRELLRTLADQGVTVVTVLDKTYPANLRYVYNRPPVLFILLATAEV
jgi:DNA processing protein